MAELSRRKVLRTVGAYAVAVFVLLQLMDAAVEPLRLPDWVPTLVVIVVILGFPLVFLLAWHLEITPTGVRRTEAAGVLSRGQSATLFSIMLVGMMGLGFVFYQYYSGVFSDSPVSPTVAESSDDRQFTAPENSIAVLPFKDFSEAQDQAHFSDGIAEELLNMLARVDGLHVAARTSSFVFRDPQMSVQEIGRLLNVGTVLEGSVRTSGNRIRLTAQLINVADGYHIWSQNYDRELDDIFAIQDEIASSIANALVENFAGLSVRPQDRSDSLAASQAYRTGRLHWWRRTPTELQKAVELFAKALELDARYAPAYAALADTWLILSQYGNISVMKATERANPMIEKALEIDPESVEAYAALGLARWQIGQLDAAESALRTAVELNEDYVPAQLWLAGVLKQQGRYPEEQMVLEKAMNLDPFNELLAVNYASNLSMSGNWESGKAKLDELIRLKPDSTMLLRFMALHEMDHGNLVEGWRLAYRAWQLQPGNPEDISMLAKAWLMLGGIKEAEELVLQGLEESEENGTLQSVYWQILLFTGRFEEASSMVQNMIQEFGPGIPEALQRNFDVQLGIIAAVQKDYALAYEFFSKAIDLEDDPAYSGDQVFVFTMASVMSRIIGKPEEAQARLQEAERKVKRARLNGVDDPQIYYAEATILAMRNEVEPALQKLDLAYQHGFRENWLMEIDYRLDPLRDRVEFIALKSQLEDEINQALAEVRSFPVAIL
jgi:TolB-like protein/Tfp pilus assembly protein PilF